MAPIQIMASAA